MHRFYISAHDIRDKEVLVSAEGFVRQLLKVLRFKAGDECVLFDGSGKEYFARTGELNKKFIRFEVLAAKDNTAELDFDLILFQALPKAQEKFEWLLEKACELGVTKLAPLITERTQRRSFSRRERLERIIIEACEQSGRGKLMELAEPISFESSLNLAVEKRFLAHEKVDHPLLKEIDHDLSGVKSVGVWIGPEGGFSESEVLQPREAGFEVIGLGRRILRTETAGLVVISALLN